MTDATKKDILSTSRLAWQQWQPTTQDTLGRLQRVNKTRWKKSYNSLWLKQHFGSKVDFFFVVSQKDEAAKFGPYLKAMLLSFRQSRLKHES